MAADWRDQYVAALKARDEIEKANVDLYDHCAKIADQKSELEKVARVQAKIRDEILVPSSPAPLVGFRRVGSPPARTGSPSGTQIRQDLSKAQQERAELQTRLDVTTKELEKLRAKSKSDSKKIAQLTANVSQLTMKLRDRDEELKGKAKLVEDVQDENVTLNLQLNMADEQAKKLRKENQDLVDRWMARMGKEADQMNDQHRFG